VISENPSPQLEELSVPYFVSFGGGTTDGGGYRCTGPLATLSANGPLRARWISDGERSAEKQYRDTRWLEKRLKILSLQRQRGKDCTTDTNPE